MAISPSISRQLRVQGFGDHVAQAVRVFGPRRCRYIGLAKTQLQHVFTVIAVSVARVDAWLTERPLAKTRRSAFASFASLAGAT